MFCIFIGVFLYLLNLQYPLLGQDFFYFFPRILSGNWHFAHAGLVPFRYDPHFCGGLGVYGNPQDVSFSLLQLLSATIDLWHAAQLSMVTMMLIGYVGWIRVGRDLLKLDDSWSHAFSLMIIASGYYLLHMVAGHMTFHTTPLLGWFIWFLFRNSAQSIREYWMRAALFGLLCTFTLYAGGYFVLMQGVLLMILLLPFIISYAEHPIARAKETVLRICIYGGVAMILSGSKLVAIVSYMRFFPRHLPFNAYVGDDPLLLFIAKSFWMIPQVNFAYDTQPYHFGLHEFSMFLSPITLLGMIVVPWMLWTKRHSMKMQQWALLAIGLVCASIITIAMTRGEGTIADALHDLPLLSSWRMNMRFLYVTGLLVVMAGTSGAAFLAQRLLNDRYANTAAIGVSVVTIATFFIAHASMISPEYLDLQMPYPQVKEGIEQSGYLHKQVTKVEDYRGQQISDFQYILSGTTGTTCYEILLTGVEFLPELRTGSVDQVDNNAFNLNHAGCLQYPAQNNCKPGARISIDDDENFLRFVSGQQPHWPLPWWQKIPDYLSLLGVIGCICWLGWEMRRKITIKKNTSMSAS